MIEAKKKGEENAQNVLKQGEIEKDTLSANLKDLGNELAAANAPTRQRFLMLR